LNGYYSNNNSELDIAIKEVKHELKAMFLKRKDLIVKLGIEFEKVVANPESVCEEIKIVLHQEIADHIISSRDIERYCPDKWKKKTKPQKNDKLSFLTKTEEQEKEEHMTIAIDTQGSPADELKPISHKSQTCIKKRNCDLETQELSTNIQSNTINLDTCPNCKQPLLENQRIHHEKDIKIKGLEDEKQQVYHALNVKSAENAGMQAQIDHLKKHQQGKNENNGSMLSSSNAYDLLESSPIVDFEFSLQCEEVLGCAISIPKVSGPLGRLWFNGKIDKITGNVIAAYPGRISERNKIDNEENSETTI
jgi:hypothetical protein